MLTRHTLHLRNGIDLQVNLLNWIHRLLPLLETLLAYQLRIFAIDVSRCDDSVLVVFVNVRSAIITAKTALRRDCLAP